MRKLILAGILSLISLCSLSQTITVIQANGGEELYACETYPITWTFAGGVSNYFDIDYSLDGGTIWASVTSSYFSNTGVFNWTVPSVESTTVLFRVKDSQDGAIVDESDNFFSIGIPVNVLSPNGGEVFTGNTVETISWDAQGTSNTFNLYYSTNNGSSWQTIVTNYSTVSGTYDWTVPNLSSNTVLIRVSDYTQSCKRDESDAVFTINPATPVITYPNGGEELLSTCSETITWDPTTFYSSVRLDYSTDNGATWNVIVTSTTNDGSHTWSNKPSGPLTECLIRGSNVSDLSSNDVSDAVFSIGAPLELTTVFTDTLYGCTSFPVAFDYSMRCESYYTYCYYSIDNGTTWTSFGTFSNASNGTSGSRSFSVPNGITSNQCKFMVCTEANGGYCDTSDYTFTILPAQIDVEVTALNGGETVQPDDNVLLSWTNTSGLIGLYDVYYSTNGGSSYTLIANDLNSLNYNWTVPNIPTDNAMIKVIFNNQSCNFDESDAPFTIGKRTPIMTYPNGGEELLSGCYLDVTWDPTTYYGNVRIDYSIDNGVVWNPITTSTANDGAHPWYAVEGPQSNVRIKVTQTNDLSHVDEADGSFTVSAPVELTTVFTDTLYGCTSLPVYFNHSKNCESSYTYCYYSIDNGVTWTSFGTYTNSSSGTTGARTFSVPNGITSNECKFMVCTESNGGFCDTSDYTFTILPAQIDVEVVDLNGGETIFPDATVTLNWTNTSGLIGTYDVYYSTNGGSSYIIIANDVSGTSYNWTVPNIPTTNGKIKVIFNNESCNFDVSDGLFEIGKRTPIMTYPNGGEDMLSGCYEYIYWDQTTYYGNVRIDYSIDNGVTWTNIITSTSNDGSHYWYPPNGPLNQVKIKIAETGDLAQVDESDAVFSIKPPVELTTVFTDTLYGCTSLPVYFNYSKNCVNSATYCYYSIDNGVTWTSFGSISNSSSSTSGVRTFSVPNGITSNECKFMICSESGGGYCDTSDYTFTILPAPIYVDVTYPNGGETFIIGEIETITWTATAESGGIYDLYYSTNGGGSFSTLASNVVGNSYDWTIPNLPGTNLMIKVVEDGQACNFDVSDATFEITPQPAVMTYPNGGEDLLSSCYETITWDQTTYYSNVRIDYSLDNGLTWISIITNTTNDGNHYWYPPIGPHDQVKIRVSQTSDLTRYDESDAVFSIKQPVELTTVFTDTLYGCTSFPVTFNYSKNCVSSYTYCYYSIDNGATWTSFGSVYNSSSGTSGSRSFNVPNGVTSDECKFMICTETNGGYCDTADYTFTILPAPIDVEVTALNGGETVQPDDVVMLSWTNTSGLIGLYDVYYSINGGSSYTLIANDVNGTNYNWTVPNSPTSNAMIKVIFNNQSCNYDESDATFTIGKRDALMTYPNGGEDLISRCGDYVYWDNTTFYSNVRIDYSIDNGITWNTITTNTANDGSHSWSPLPTGPLSDVLVKVSETSDLSHFDVSDATFSIKPPLELTTVFTDTLYGCTSMTVNYNTAKSCESGTTYCYYSIDNGTTWTLFGTSTNSSSYAYGSRTFSVPNGITSNECKFKVCTETNEGGYCDESDYTFTILPASIDVTLTSPNGGESYQAGSNALISWTNTPAVSGPYDLYYSLNGGSTWSQMANDVVGNNFNWTVPNTPSTNCLVEVRVNGQSCNTDESDNVFTIEPKDPLVLLPNGGEEFYSGMSTTITWDQTTFYSNVRIEYSADNGITWNIITTSTTNDGSQSWTLPNENSAECLIRVTQTNDFSRYDISDNNFRIKPAVTIITPNGDDGFTDWGGCTVTSITFDRSPAWNRYNIYYSIDGGTNWTYIVSNWYNASNPATYNWTMPNIPTDQALVKVEPYYQTDYYDESDATFTITKPVTLTQPNFGGVMQAGSIYNIEWNSEGISNIYDLYYSTDNGVTWNTIVIGYNTSDNTYAWTVPNTLSNQCLIRVEDNIANCKQDISDVPFTITNSAPSITLLTPNGGETLTGCATTTIDWSEAETFGTYDISYSTNGGASWTIIEEDYATTGATYNWSVPNIDESGVLVRVLVSGTVTEDFSDALFTIQSNSVDITTANQTVCSQTDVQLTAVNGTTYSWSPAGTLDNPTIANPIASPTETTWYYVTSTDGICSSTDSVLVTVENNPSIVAGVNIIADQSTTICAGTTVSFNATPTNGGGAPIYDWLINGASTGFNGNTFSTSSLVNGDIVSVQMTSNMACVTGSPVISNQMSFTVNDLLLPSVIATETTDSICIGESVTFTAASTNGGANPTYVWKVNGVANGMTTSSITLNNLVDGDVVTVEMTSNEACVTTPTVTSNMVTMYVFDVPTTPSAITGTSSICENELVNYSVTNDPNVQNYIWSIPGTWSGTSSTNQITVAGDLTGLISVEAQNQCGNSTASTMNVTVNTLPTVTGIATNLTICLGDSVALTGNGASTYIWNNSVVDGTYFEPTATNEYIVTGTDVNGCQNSDTISIAINALPTIAITGDNQICQGEVTNLIATGGVAYEWDDNSMNATNTVSPTLTTSYSVTGTDANGCANTASYIVSVETSPTVFIAGNTSACEGDAVSLTASGAITYTWDNNFAGDAQTIVVEGDTTLTVTGTTSNGCSSSESITINVNPQLTVGISGTLSICEGESTVLTASGANNFVWSTNENTSSIVVSPTSTIVYSVTGSTAGSCPHTTDVTVIVNAAPSVLASSDLAICEGQNATISASGATSYSWDNGAGAGSSVSVSPTSTTTYTVTGTNANGCTSQDQVTVSVNAAPTITTSADAIICAGESVDLIASGATSYTWDNGAGNTALVTVTPTNSTSYTVTGTNGNGCSNTATVNVSVNAAPSVAINGVTEICAGESITLAGSGATNYTWGAGLGNSSSITVSPTSTTVYTLTGTNANGCENTTSHTVTVHPASTIDAGTNVAICEGQSTTLTATGGSTYTWDNGLGNGNDITVSPTTTTTYNVSSTDVNGCSATDAITVTVNASPTVTASSNVVICEGESTDLSASGASSYSWDNGAGNGVLVTVSPTTSTAYTVTGTTNGCSSTAQVVVTVNQAPNLAISANTEICVGSSTILNASGAFTYSWDNALGNNASVSVSPMTTTTYTVTGTGTNGCSISEAVTVNVNALPVVVASNDVAICSGEATTLTASGADSYVWNNGGGAGSSVSVSPLNLTTYTVTGTTLAGCTATDEVVVSVNALPTIIASDDAIICEGEAVNLSASGANSYSWNNGVGNGSTVSVAPTSTTDYIVTGTDNNGCTDTDIVTVTVNQAPTITINGNTTVCAGSETTLSATGASTYVWANGLGSNASVTVAPTVATTYEVEGTGSNGCTATEQISVTINSVDVSVSIEGVHVTAVNAFADSYQWIDCDNNNIALTGQTNQTYTANSDGSYAVIVSQNGCIDTSACYLIGGVGIDEMDGTSLSVFPNPTKGKVTVENATQDQAYILLSISGQVIATGTFNEGSNEIDLTDQARGIYLLKVNETTIRISKE